MQGIAYIAWLGAAVSMYGTVRYIIGVCKDGTQPRLASWIAWFIANAAMMFMALSHGAHNAAIFDGLSAAGNAGVLIVAAIKRQAQKPTGAMDWTCLAVAGICSVANASLPNLAMMGTLLAMFANLVATWPTMQHAWQEPFAETWQLFAANAGASMLGVVGVGVSGGFKLTSIAGPLVAMVGNIALTSIALGRRYSRAIVAEVSEIQAVVVEEIATVEQGVTQLEQRIEERVSEELEPLQPARKRGLLGSQAGF